MIKTILWDFDGVILDSMKVRDLGFEKIFKEFDKNLVKKLLIYHRENGGLSRYVKIRFFFEELLNQSVSDEKVLSYAKEFSELMREELTNPEYLKKEVVEFIESNYNKYNFHIVSGSDQDELRFLCSELKIRKYFKSINGSPTHKNILVQNLLIANDYKKEESCLIGDSINDYEAAKYNGINFYGYNNKSLSIYGKYIYSFMNYNF